MPKKEWGGNSTAGVFQSRRVIAMTWLALALPHPAFSADTLAAEPATAQSNINPGNASAEVKEFLSTDAATPADAGASASKPASSLRLAPIATRLGGVVGYDIEQRTNNAVNAQIRQIMTLNLLGQASTYIWQPWIAKVNSTLGFNATKSKSDDSSSSGNNSIMGSAGVYLVPYSRFPFDANVSKSQNYSGGGIGTLSSQTTRWGVQQSYRPREGMESYQAAYYRSKTDSGAATDRLTGYNVSVLSNRFKYQTIDADISNERDLRQDGNTTLTNQAIAHHRYRPSAALTLDNNANQLAISDRVIAESSHSKTRELNSTLSFQPLLQPYSAIGSVRVFESDLDNKLGQSHTVVANANLGGSYRPSQYTILSASANANKTTKDHVKSSSRTTSQSASTNYPLVNIKLNPYDYIGRFSGSISNTTNQTASVQSITLNPNHSLTYSRNNLYWGLNQSVLVSESTRSQATATLSHSISANQRYLKGKRDTTLKMNAADTRSLTRAQESFQIVNLNVTTSEEFSRYSKLTGGLSVQASRQTKQNPRVTNTHTSSSAFLHYGLQRAFNISGMAFDSDLRAASQAPIPVLAATEKEQGPISWDNSLAYTVGRLAAKLSVNLSRESDDTTQSFIALSLKRYF